MKPTYRMTCKEIRAEILANRVEIRTTKSLSTKSVLINRNHDLMTELDSRYNRG